MKPTLANSLAALALLMSAGASQALTLSHTEANGQQVSAQLSSTALGGSLLTADIGFDRGTSVSFDLTLDAADIGQTFAFNALISALNGYAIDTLEVRLSQGADFSWVGSLKPTSTNVASEESGAQFQRYTLSPAEDFGINLGNPTAQAGASDWQIGNFTLQAGDTVTLTISSAVPEPSSTLLALAGAGLLGLTLRRRR